MNLLTDAAQYTTLDFVKFIVNISEQTTNFFYKSAFLEFLFFPKSCLKVGSAAYTRVFTLVLFSWYSITIISFVNQEFYFSMLTQGYLKKPKNSFSGIEPGQCGPVVSMLALRSGYSGIKTRSSSLLVVPGSTSQLHL